MPGDVEVQVASTSMAGDEEAIEQAKGVCGRGEEVHGRNRPLVVSEESKPILGWLGISWHPSQPTRDRSLADIKTERKKPTADARHTPGGIFNHHPEDQLSNSVRRRLLPTRLVTIEISFQYQRKPGRCQRTTVLRVTMIRLFPILTRIDDRRPRAIHRTDFGRGATAAGKYDELFALRKILNEETWSCTKEVDRHSEVQTDDLRHVQES